MRLKQKATIQFLSKPNNMNKTQHNNQWNYNEQVITWLQKQGFSYNDWLITITFYTALHKMERCLHDRGIWHKEIKNHKTRNTQIIREFRGKVVRSYMDLYDESKRVRYFQSKLHNIPEPKFDHFLQLWKRDIKPFKP